MEEDLRIYVHVREILKGLAFASLGEIHLSVQIYDNKTRLDLRYNLLPAKNLGLRSS